jgi:hypothetical protein
MNSIVSTTLVFLTLVCGARSQVEHKEHASDAYSLRRMMESKSPWDRGFVMGYLTAFSDATQSEGAVCLPEEGVSEYEMVAVVRKYIDDHPTTLHGLPGVAVVEALKAAYPCSVQKTK